jgi:hypothetical protein
MRKLFILLFLLPFSLFGQTTYQLNYDSIRVNKTTGTGGTSLYGKVYLKNVTTGLTSDSILSVRNGRILKVPAPSATGGTGGGASVSYYLNGSVNQGTFVGNVYREMNKTPILGAGTDFTIATNGYITQFITDANDPGSLLIPAGNWNFETYFSASSGGGNPSFYVELYKYNGSTFTLIASNSATPELISFGTSIQPYFSALAVPETVLLATDRLAVRIYVNNSGRTITLHTEGAHLCQIVTTFTTGLQSLNGLTKQIQSFATGTSGTDFNISSVTDLHTFNIPSASGSNRGLVTTGTQTFAGAKTFTDVIKPNGSSGLVIYSNAATTGLTYSAFQNTGAQMKFGISSSVGSAIFSNESAYSTVFGSGNATSLQFATNNIVRATFASGGDLSLTGTVSSTPQGTLYGTASASITSAQLATSLTDETGTGSVVFSASPTFTGTINGAGITVANITSTAGDAISATFTNNATSFETFRATNNGSGLIAAFRNSAGEVASISNAGSISSTPQGTLYGTATNSFTSSQLATSLTDETGSGLAVFATTPTLTAGNNANTVLLNNTGNSTPFGPAIQFTAAAPNNATQYFLTAADNSTTRFSVYSNGGIANYSANNVNLSDIRTKKNISDVSSYWDKIKAINIVNFQYKDEKTSEKRYKIGVIAQQVEEVSPEFVSNQGFGETPSDGIPLKSVYDSSVQYATIKALQEAMTRIEALEARITALEAQTQPNN